MNNFCLAILFINKVKKILQLAAKKPLQIIATAV